MKRWLLLALVVLPASAGIYGPPGGGLTQEQADLLYAPIGSGGSPCDTMVVGSIYLSVLPTNPATLLGCGTWSQIAQGRALVGQDPGDTQFDTAEEASGAKTVASAGTVAQPTFTGTPFSSVINHTHPVTDPGHAHVITSQTATTGGATSYEHGTLDTSSADAEATEVTASATTGVTTSNPAGGVASITPAGTVSQPAYTGSATSVVQPSFVIYVWKRTL